MNKTYAKGLEIASNKRGQGGIIKITPFLRKS